MTTTDARAVVRDALWLVRLPIVAVSCLAAAAAAGSAAVPWTAVLALGLMLAAGYVVSDLLDLDTDRVSAPHRPLPAQRISASTAAGVAVAAAALSLLVAGLSGSPALTLYLVLYGAMFAVYSLALRRHWVVKELVTAAAFASAALVPALTDADTFVVPWSLVAQLALFTLGREIVMDVRDAHGDAVSGARRPRSRTALVVGFALALGALGWLASTALPGWLATVQVVLLAALAGGLLRLGVRTPLWSLAEALKLTLLSTLAAVVIVQATGA